jgi:hypothetical protein
VFSLAANKRKAVLGSQDTKDNLKEEAKNMQRTSETEMFPPVQRGVTVRDSVQENDKKAKIPATLRTSS